MLDTDVFGISFGVLEIGRSGELAASAGLRDGVDVGVDLDKASLCGSVSVASSTVERVLGEGILLDSSSGACCFADMVGIMLNKASSSSSSTI